MKKYYLLSLMAILISFSAKSQKLQQYAASNGVTYHVGDTIRLGRGSGTNGQFVYFTASWLLGAESDIYWIKKKYTNGAVPIKSIKSKERNGVKAYTFAVGNSDLYSYYIEIENAIEACEVVPCKKKEAVSGDRFDQLKKLKDLFDSGALTQAEYDEQKKKLLNQ